MADVQDILAAGSTVQLVPESGAQVLFTTAQGAQVVVVDKGVMLQVLGPVEVTGGFVDRPTGRMFLDGRTNAPIQARVLQDVALSAGTLHASTLTAGMTVTLPAGSFLVYTAPGWLPLPAAASTSSTAKWLVGAGVLTGLVIAVGWMAIRHRRMRRTGSGG